MFCIFVLAVRHGNRLKIFFFHAEDGIRDATVTGVQTCALPISLLKSRRRELHRLVAHTLSEKFAGLEETQPEVLARHWTEAGETEQAIAQWSKAGKAAESRNAFVEAQESYQQALTLLKLLPESPERDVSELQLRQSLVSMLHMTRGWAAPETLQAAERAGLLSW